MIEGIEGDRGRADLEDPPLHDRRHLPASTCSTILLSADPDEEDEAPPRWLPETTPTPLELAGAELWRRATMPITAVRGLVSAAQQPNETLGHVREQVSAVVEALSAGLVPASDTPLNQELGPHRRFDWLTTDLTPVREIKKRLGGTVNDVVLATVAGALGDFLEQRGVTRRPATRTRDPRDGSGERATRRGTRHHRQPDRTLGRRGCRSPSPIRRSGSRRSRRSPRS